MTLQDIVQRLRIAGLKVNQQSVFGRPGCVVYSNWEQCGAEHTVLIGDVSHIWRQRGHWFYRQWRQAPLPGPDDIEFETDDPDSLITAVVNRYLGHATPIGAWLVPLQRHPEWDEMLLRQLIKGATRLTETEWTQIREQHEKTLQFVMSNGSTSDADLLRQIHANTFSFAVHTGDTARTLFIRRDQGCAYDVGIAPPLAAVLEQRFDG